MPRREEVDLSKYNIFETDEFQKQLRKITSAKRLVIEKKLSEYVYPQLKSAPYYGPKCYCFRHKFPYSYVLVLNTSEYCQRQVIFFTVHAEA